MANWPPQFPTRAGSGLWEGATATEPGSIGNCRSLRSRRAGRWGVGLITWRATSEALEQVLSYHPDVVFLSFGDARPFVPSITDSGCRLVCQVQDVEDALEAKALGAGVIVAQGAEAGGHGSVRATLPLVPAIVDAVNPTPVLAAGGIGDGRGLAAVLALGAAGAVIGTRFCAAEESLMHPLAKQRLISSAGGETVRTHVFDEVRGIEWPKGYTGRALRNAFVDRWHDRDEGLGNDLAERERYLAAAEQGDFDTAMILAGEVVDMVESVELASEILERIGREAEDLVAPCHDACRLGSLRLFRSAQSYAVGSSTTRYRCQRSGTPLSSCSPASSKVRPEPATRSFTVCAPTPERPGADPRRPPRPGTREL